MAEGSPEALGMIEALVEPHAKGDPGGPLRWASKSSRAIERALAEQGRVVSDTTILGILRMRGHPLQADMKDLSATPGHADRDSKFEHIDRTAHAFMEKGLPVVSVDAKKKEKVGNFKNGGVEHRGAGATYMTADSGGSNGSKVRPWKTEPQKLADELGVTLKVSHFPPGTSKWNKIGRPLFSFASKNWRGRPLTSLAVIADLIGATSTQAGLKVLCAVDSSTYEKGVRVSDEELAEVNIARDPFHGEWNYETRPGKRDLL
jgi:hypothetical protein